MSDNSQDLRIHIISDADTMGFTTASAATAKLKVDTSDLSDETKKQLGLLEPAAGGHEKLGKKIEEAGGHMEKGEREMRRLANEIGNMAGVSDAGALTMGKMGAAVFGVGAALEFLLATWKDMQAAAQGPINITVRDDAGKTEAVAKALDIYAEAKRKASEGDASAESAFGRENKLLENKLKLLQEVLKAEEAEALAALATHESQMSPQSYAAAQQRIKTSFGEKSTAAEEDTQKARLAAMQKEADALEASAAKKKAQGEALTSPRAADAQSAAMKTAEDAKKALVELQKTMEIIQRFMHPDNAEYMSATGKVQQAQDWWALQKMAGADQSLEDVKRNVELQQAQAQAQIRLGEQAGKQGAYGGELLGQAGTESAKAEALRNEIKRAMDEYNAGVDTNRITEAIGAGTRAIGQEQAAEGNNTQQGTRDALSALSAGTNAAALLLAVKDLAGSNTEQMNAVVSAINDVAAENRRLAALIRNMPLASK